MKKFVSLFVLLLSFSLIIVGCSSGSSSEGGSEDGSVTLSVFSTISDQNSKQVFEEIIDEFEKENPGIVVETNFPGGEYENLLKVKMAANDMPDLFDTHGWAQIRYGDYLADLQDEEWVSQLTDTIKPVVTDEAGKVYALPLNEAKEGVTYNEEILEEYGIEPPKTFTELMEAAEKIHKESNGEIAPFFFAGADSWTIGQFFDYYATPLLISDEENNYGEELLNGNFDWSDWTYLPEKCMTKV
jgi:raffinose/stachyose/melibiose transport system substrate-binding protein